MFILRPFLSFVTFVVLSERMNMDRSIIVRNLRRDNPRWVILMIDMLIVFLCYLVSNFIIDGFRGNFNIPLIFKKSILILASYSTVFLLLGTYKGIIRQAGIKDAMQVFKAVFITLVFLMLISIGIRSVTPKATPIGDYLRLSYSVLFMHAFFTMVVMVAARIFYRTIYEAFFFRNRKQANSLIFGASGSGLMALSILAEDTRVKHSVLAFVEDDSTRVGKRLAGLKVLDIEQITTEYVQDNNIERVIIAVENNDPERLRKIAEKFEALELYIKFLPPTNLVSDGERRQIRALKIEDLLGRKVITLNNPAIESEMYGKSILVTGAAGSIGSELARQIAIRGYDHLILLDQAESPLYNLQQSLKASKPHNVSFIVGNVRNKGFMRELFARYCPNLVFHAAAYKHVPLMESNPYEAILTNVLGTKNIADLAIEFKAEKFVMVSTDKAVNPTNIMGATKRAAEMYVSSCFKKSNTKFIVTRFGNVLGSNGSVIPLFEQQIDAGGPLTLTHPKITRYFMTIPEACQLVQEAGVMGKGGEVFVFDMGEPIKILDLAKQMIRLKGYHYPKDIDIKITGLRPGEKIFEELLSNDENTQKTHHEKILIAKINQENINEKRILLEKLCQMVKDSRHTKVETLELVKLLKNIVPEYISQNSEFEALDKEVVDY
jgi:FlaA1/EpsC-like NDP-sugar epimerase